MIENVCIIKNKTKYNTKKNKNKFYQKNFYNKNHVFDAKNFEKLKIYNDNFEKNINNEKKNVVDRGTKKRHYCEKN